MSTAGHEADHVASALSVRVELDDDGDLVSAKEAGVGVQRTDVQGLSHFGALNEAVTEATYMYQAQSYWPAIPGLLPVVEGFRRGEFHVSYPPAVMFYEGLVLNAAEAQSTDPTAVHSAVIRDMLTGRSEGMRHLLHPFAHGTSAQQAVFHQIAALTTEDAADGSPSHRRAWADLAERAGMNETAAKIVSSIDSPSQISLFGWLGRLQATELPGDLPPLPTEALCGPGEPRRSATPSPRSARRRRQVTSPQAKTTKTVQSASATEVTTPEPDATAAPSARRAKPGTADKGFVI